MAPVNTAEVADTTNATSKPESHISRVAQQETGAGETKWQGEPAWKDALAF